LARFTGKELQLSQIMQFYTDLCQQKFSGLVLLVVDEGKV